MVAIPNLISALAADIKKTIQVTGRMVLAIIRLRLCYWVQFRFSNTIYI